MSFATPTALQTAIVIANLFMAAYMEARARTLDHVPGVVTLLGTRDQHFAETKLLERELEVFRTMRQRIPPKQRPHYSPETKGMILKLMAMRNWSIKKTAERFVVHPNTIRKWIDQLDEEIKGEKRIGSPPWNKLHESVRWLVQEMRRLCPEPEFGTRTIARHIVRAGIQISRSSVQRMLQEQACKPRTPEPQRKTKAPPSIQHPTEPHQVWDLDMTELRVLWLKFEIAVILDGFTRKIIEIKAFSRRSTTNDLVKMVEVAIAHGICPRLLVTDRGSQFRDGFKGRVERRGLEHARCSFRNWQLNAKVERVNRSIRAWAMRCLIIPRTETLQARLDAYQHWHNHLRPHAAHDTLTPCEAEAGITLETPVRYTQNGAILPEIHVRRMSVRSDPSLLYPAIQVKERRLSAA
ncbi:MAG: DDE-type integrase/transposase/recombinase [Planctomycetota bacterium]